MADKLDLDLCCRQMKGTQISQIGRQGKHSDLRANWMVAEMAALALGTMQLHSFAWNQKLTKYVKDGQLEKATQHFQQMQWEGMAPDKFTFVQVITAYASLQRLEGGRLAHEQLIRSGCKSDVFVGTSLVDMYAKCGSIEDAGGVFNKMQSQNVVSWNAMA